MTKYRLSVGSTNGGARAPHISNSVLCDFAGNKDLIGRLLTVLSPGGAIDERAMPGDHLDSGWWRRMVGRYVLASRFVRGSDSVLDAFTGYGWGAWLIHESTAARVHGVDCDADAILFAQKTWSPGPTYSVGDCVEEGLPEADVVCAMEALEHLTDDQAANLVRNIDNSRCRATILSSIFPEVPRPAPATSPSHKRLFSRAEVREMFGLDWSVEFTRDALVAVATRRCQ